MKSTLSELEFKNCLLKNMVLGDPIWLITPFWLIIILFRSSNKNFLGEYTESHFKLTKRTTFFPIPYVIEGNYKTLNESETEVSFEIKSIMGFNLWISGTLVALFILFLSFVFSSIIGWIGGVFFLGILTYLVLVLPIRIISKRKRQMENTFKNIFKITD